MGNLLSKYALPTKTVNEACDTLRSVVRVELAEALAIQATTHELPLEEVDNLTQLDQLKRMNKLFESSRIVANCLTIDAFIDHVKKGLY